MKKLGKFFEIFIKFLVLFFICEFTIYYMALQAYPKNYKPPFKYFTSNPAIKYDSFKDFFNGKDEHKGRAPDGLEYKNKKPIVLFGGSYTYGYNLKKEQTFSYKLAHILKQPVYNRSVTATTLPHMLLQLSTEDFYNEIPTPEKIIYVFTENHFEALYKDGRFDIADDRLYLHYTLKNGYLEKDSYDNPYKNFFKSLYFVNYIKQKFWKKYIIEKKNVNNITDYTLQFFLQSRTEIQKRYHYEPEFIVFFFHFSKRNLLLKNTLKQKLTANGFKVIDKEDITNEDLFNNKYRISPKDFHPNEKAWDLLTPLIAEKIKSP